MKVLVTGATGLLGSNLVRMLLDEHYEVHVLLRDKNKKTPTLDGLRLFRCYGDILNYNSLNNAMHNIDIVVHCAAFIQINPARSEKVKTVNIEGTKNIIEACLKNDIKRLIHVGTANSFASGPKNNPGIEDTPYVAAKYGFDYMDSKRIAQELVLNAVEHNKLPAIVVNPTMMIGPYDIRPSSGAFILALCEQKIPAISPGGRNYIAVQDVARAIVNAISIGKVGECYILGNHNLTYKEAYKVISELAGVKPPRVNMPSYFVKAFGSINSFLGRVFNYKPPITKEITALSCEEDYYSSEKAKNELKLPSTPFAIAVEDCINWFKNNNYLN